MQSSHILLSTGVISKDGGKENIKNTYIIFIIQKIKNYYCVYFELFLDAARIALALNPLSAFTALPLSTAL